MQPVGWRTSSDLLVRDEVSRHLLAAEARLRRGRAEGRGGGHADGLRLARLDREPHAALPAARAVRPVDLAD